MIRILRHLAIRCWLLLLWGLPTGLWLLPRALVWVPGLSPVMALALFLMAGGLIQGLILDLTGRYRILGLIREGELWEQAGVRPRAEEQFVRAVRIFDSAQISVWTGQKLSRELTRAMAGFYLTGPTRYPGFRLAAARYLLYRPEDETLALLWLDRYLGEFREATGNGLTRSVLAALAETHHNHPQIAGKLLIPFVEQERNDLPAKRLYRSVMTLLEAGRIEISPAWKGRIETLLAEETLAGTGRDAVSTLAGDPAAEPALGSESHLGSAAEPASEAMASPSDEPTQGPTLGERMGTGGVSEPLLPNLQSAGRRGSRTAARILGRSANMAGTAALGLGRGMTRGVSLAGAGAGKLARILGREAGKKRGIKKHVKAVLISALAVWLGFFLWSSLAHMLKSTSREPVEAPQVSGPVSGPFTIQVAAYLKQAHADRYVQALREKGVTAQVKKTLGGGKTWFLVRVSTFPSKEAAAEYGRTLKAQGKIDDFFVSNT